MAVSPPEIHTADMVALFILGNWKVWICSRFQQHNVYIKFHEESSVGWIESCTVTKYHDIKTLKTWAKSP